MSMVLTNLAEVKADIIEMKYSFTIRFAYKFHTSNHRGSFLSQIKEMFFSHKSKGGIEYNH